LLGNGEAAARARLARRGARRPESHHRIAHRPAGRIDNSHGQRRRAERRGQAKARREEDKSTHQRSTLSPRG
jgi:hypothetical protein